MHLTFDKIWHGGCPQRGEVLGWVNQYPKSPGYGVPKMGFSGVLFWKNFIKHNLQGTPNLGRVCRLNGPQIWFQKDLGLVFSRRRMQICKEIL